MKNPECFSRTHTITEDAVTHEERKADEKKGRHRKYSLTFHLISSVLLIFTGITVLKVTGLYDGMHSSSGKLILCISISYLYLTAFRRGLYSR